MSANGDGACNADGVRLMPRSLQGGGCGDGADLTLDETRTKLVGLKRGSRVCEGPSLTGASFTVKRGEKTVHLTIAKVQPFNDDGPDKRMHEGYLITNHDQSVCQFDAARGVLRELGFRMSNSSSIPPLVADGYKPGDDDDLVVAMAGPVFDVETAEPIKALDPTHFFNLACAGDALAKASFYELAGEQLETKAALRVITANYCGMRLTVRGVHIEWEKFPRDHEASKLEAEWDQDGKALCIEHPRLMELTVRSGDHIVSTKELPTEL